MKVWRSLVRLVPRVSHVKGVQRNSSRMVVVNNYASVDRPENCVDMRSDTVTLPTTAMRQVMLTCPVGDDVYGDDASVKALEKRCAELFNKEAALFVVSGTMGNLLAVMAHCRRGEEIIVGQTNHIHRWEQGNYAQLAGISATTLPVNEKGEMDLDAIETSIRPLNDIHMSETKLICLETTHNYSGGVAVDLEYLASVRNLADKYGLKVHIDGARIYNAAVHMGVSIADISKYADTAMMCFSKGLGAPIGSIVVGPQKFIDDVKRSRKAIGGGWRQAGVLAAAASISLDNAVQTIERDHRNTRRLAEGLEKATPPPLKSSLFVESSVMTNMVLLHCVNKSDPVHLQAFLRSKGILVMVFDARRIRMIPNVSIKDSDIDRTLEAYKEYVHDLLENPIERAD